MFEDFGLGQMGPEATRIFTMITGVVGKSDL
jgi:hypothetical protein